MNQTGRLLASPRTWVAVLGVSVAVAVFCYVRLDVFSERLVPLTYALPLLLAIWHDRRWLLYANAVTMAVLVWIQVYWAAPAGLEAGTQFAAFAMMQINVWMVAGVLDVVLIARQRLLESNTLLQETNEELEATNEELAAREEEISKQNEELRSQAEELEQQSEELRQQSEELHLHAEELHHFNQQTANRERVLAALFQVSMHLGQDDQHNVLADLCRVTTTAFGLAEPAAMVFTYQGEGDRLTVAGSHGTDDASWTNVEEHGCYRFANLVATEQRTASVEDLAAASELAPPHGLTGQPFQSVLGTPLRVGKQTLGVLLIYGKDRHAWSDVDFKVIEWVAAQAAQLLRSLALQSELESRRVEAEEASIRKTRFLAAVSHDVRTPANVISLMAELLARTSQGTEFPDEIREMAEALQRNAKLLVDLVSDVLDLSRFDSGKIDIDEKVFSLNELIEAEIAQYQPLAISAGLTLTKHLPGQPIWLRSDRMKISRVLGNLLGNAMKFTDHGAVCVTCHQREDGGVQLQVTDTGMGIPASHLECIFDEFFQIRNPERDRSKGTGLGLAICRRLVEALGCSLTVHSEVGKGSEFTLGMPAEILVDAPLDAPMPVIAASLPVARRLAGMRVLLVEDHDATRMAISQLLASEGARVETAADGRAALHHLARQEFDAALLDLMLPDMDGREILRRINGQRPASLRCVLVVSGDVTDSRQHEILGLGADALVAKPVTIDSLVALMGELCASPEAGLELNNGISARGQHEGLTHERLAEDDLQQS